MPIWTFLQTVHLVTVALLPNLWHETPSIEAYFFHNEQTFQQVYFHLLKLFFLERIYLTILDNTVIFFVIKEMQLTHDLYLEQNLKNMYCKNWGSLAKDKLSINYCITKYCAEKAFRTKKWPEYNPLTRLF